MNKINTNVSRFSRRNDQSHEKRSGCFRCGRLGHFASSMQARKVRSRRCNKPGHFEKKCAKPIFERVNINDDDHDDRPAKRNNSNVRNIEDAVFNIGNDIEIICKVGGINVSMIFDSESSYNMVDDHI